jgi:hypothetical protein
VAVRCVHCGGGLRVCLGWVQQKGHSFFWKKKKEGRDHKAMHKATSRWTLGKLTHKKMWFESSENMRHRCKGGHSPTTITIQKAGYDGGDVWLRISKRARKKKKKKKKKQKIRKNKAMQ